MAHEEGHAVQLEVVKLPPAPTHRGGERLDSEEQGCDVVLHPARRGDSLGESRRAAPRQRATSPQERDDDDEVSTLGLGNAVVGGGTNLVTNQDEQAE